MPENPTVVFAEAGKVVIEDRAIPTPGEGQVLVKTRRSLISTGTELTILGGKYPPGSAWAAWGKFPFAPGYSSVGEVCEVGPGVDASLVGKRFAHGGRHAMLTLANAAGLTEIRAEVDDDVGAFATIAAIVYNGVRRGEPEWGESAVVYGLGLLGQMAVRCLVFAGLKPVFAVDVSRERLALLPAHKRIVPMDPNEGGVRETVEKMTKGRMADVVYEVTGVAELIPREFEALRWQGRFVILSSPAAPTLFDFNELSNVPSTDIIGAHVRSSPPAETPYNRWTRGRNRELFFDMAADGDIEMEKMITHREPYTKAPELYRMLIEDRSKAMGVVFQWQ